jgi:TonB family protein
MFDMLLFVTLGLTLVLASRKPVRWLFGAGPAFTLWLLPLILATAPWLPVLPASWTIMPAQLVLPAAPAFVAHIHPIGATQRWPLLLWLAVALPLLLRLAAHYVGLMRQNSRLPHAMLKLLQADLDGLDPRRLRMHPAGPAVLWAPRSLLLVPPDFLERFDASERCLVLQHEHAHLRRGDALWSLLAALVFALLWFHPLMWLAMPRLRLDQELACDERVLCRSPRDQTKYAQTLLRSAGMELSPVLIPWLAEPQLKERLSMIQRLRPGVLRRRIGFIGLAALMVGGTFAAQAAAHARTSQPVQQDLSFNAHVQMHYPEDAVKNKQQGTVILVILVGTDGKVRKIDVDPTTQASPSLVKAASDAAMQWRFNPAVRNGKRIESYAKVPVNFSLDESPKKTSTPDPMPKSPASVQAP